MDYSTLLTGIELFNTIMYVHSYVAVYSNMTRERVHSYKKDTLTSHYSN